jgi:hypothetical protein
VPFLLPLSLAYAQHTWSRAPEVDLDLDEQSDALIGTPSRTLDLTSRPVPAALLSGPTGSQTKEPTGGHHGQRGARGAGPTPPQNVGAPARPLRAQRATSNPRLTRRILAAVLGSATVGLLVLAGLVIDHERHPPGPKTAVVDVPGRRSWTDTGFDMRQGVWLTVTATGLVHQSDTGPGVGPEGVAARQLRGASILPDVPHGALIGKIGKAGPPFPVGRRLVMDVPMSNRLYLGINDNDVENNSGSFTAVVVVGRP